MDARRGSDLSVIFFLCICMCVQTTSIWHLLNRYAETVETRRRSAERKRQRRIVPSRTARGGILGKKDAHPQETDARTIKVMRVRGSLWRNSVFPFGLIGKG